MNNITDIIQAAASVISALAATGALVFSIQSKNQSRSVKNEISEIKTTLTNIDNKIRISASTMYFEGGQGGHGSPDGGGGGGGGAAFGGIGGAGGNSYKNNC